ncbi:hypothetical protein IQ238_05285 [Pleurocapsales cyanobacterium LEGE 06147]|nr:hypothetical protein [Pleurocapsales cyanobacterium LEGE 06147]
MSDLYLWLFISTCFGLLAWGIIRLERIYQYPFFMGATFVSFVLPQAIALYNNPGIVTQTALARVLLMSCLCAAMCWLGYQLPPNPQWLKKLNISLDERKLFRAGIALMILGYFFNFLLSITNIQTAANSNWTGPATIYVFFAQVIYIAFAIFLLQTLKYPTAKNIIYTILASIPLLSTIISAGRRQPTIIFLVIIGLSFWYARRFTPPRWLIILLIFLSIYIIPALGHLRGNFWNLVFSNDWQSLSSSSQASLDSVLEGKTLELRNAALLMDAATHTSRYGYGTGYWDSFIFQYVPGQILGYDFKESLQFKWGAYNLGLYNYSIPRGSTNTGIGDSFVEFDYFGCLIFAFIGFIFKNIWISSVYQKSVTSKLIYIGLLSPAMVGITHGTSRFFQEAIFQLTFIGLVAYYSRVKHHYYELKNNE